MTPTTQILGINAAGTPPTAGSQPVTSDSTANTQGFNALLEVLASLMTGNGVVQPTAAQNSSVTAQSSCQPSKEPASSGTPPDPAMTALYQQLAAMLSGSLPSRGSKGSATDLQTATEYSPAGLPVTLPYLGTPDNHTQSEPTSSALPSLPGLTPAVLSQAENELASLAEQYQLSSTQGEPSASVANTPQPSSPSGKTIADPTGAAQQAAISPPVIEELTNLLSIASGSAPDPKAVKELSTILAGMIGDGSVSQQNILARLEALDPAAAPAQLSQQGSQVNPANSSAGLSSLQGRTLSQQTSLAAGKIIPQGTGTTVSVSQGDSTTILTPQSNSTTPSGPQGNGTTASPAHSLSLTTSGTVEYAASQSNPVTTATSGAGSTAVQSGSASQATNRPAPPASAQPGQIQAAATGQGNQNSAASDKGSADLMKADASQAYLAVAGQQKASTTFQQTLSAVSENQPSTFARPDALQLAQSIVKEVNMMSQQGKTIVNMKLEPESLGSVTLQVSSEGGKISAQFDVKSTDARAYLESSVPEIRQALETNGVSVSHLGVSLSGGELPAGKQKFGYQPKRQQARYFSGQQAVSTPVAGPETSRSFGYNTMEMQL